MAGKIVPSAHTTVSAATNLGYVTVGSSTGFIPSAFVWLSGTAGNLYCKVTDVPDGTHVGLRILTDPGTDPSMGQRNPAPIYSRSDVSAFNSAGGFLDQESQLIYTTASDNSLPTQG